MRAMAEHLDGILTALFILYLLVRVDRLEDAVHLTPGVRR